MSEHTATMHCALCDNTDALVLYAHRNDHRHIIGWLFACPTCSETLAGKDIQLVMDEEEKTP